MIHRPFLLNEMFFLRSFPKRGVCVEKMKNTSNTKNLDYDDNVFRHKKNNETTHHKRESKRSEQRRHLERIQY